MFGWSLTSWLLFCFQFGKRRYQTDKLTSFQLVKLKVFCVGDRLKMDKHKAWS